jgi:serine/threonine protein kinase
MDPFEQVRRRNLKQYLAGRIGRGNQGSIYKIHVNGRTAVVKDIAGKSLLYRLLFGRWLLAREYKVYVRLQGLTGIPKLYHTIDRDGFIFEYIEGTPLSDFPKDAPLPTRFFDALNELVANLHSRGVVHSDLKHKKNILVGMNYTPYLVDFGASFLLGPPWNFGNRWLYRQFQQIDQRAVSKIRRRFLHGNPNEKDLESLRQRNVMEKTSALYQSVYRLFSRKHRWRRRRRI